MLEPSQIKAAAKASLEAGPTIQIDEEGKHWAAYVMFLREGPVYSICLIDQLLIDANAENVLEFMEAEALAICEGLDSQQEDARVALATVLATPREFLYKGA